MTNLMKLLSAGLCVLAVCGCKSQQNQPPQEVRVVASLDRQNSVAFVDPDYAAQVAKLWHVEDPSAGQWTVARGKEKPIEVSVVRKSPDGLAADSSDVVYQGCRCTGNHPPATDDTGCQASSNGPGSWQVKQTVGYSFCKSTGNKNDMCDASHVQVGDWIYYSDRSCSTETRRVPFKRSVCLP